MRIRRALLVAFVGMVAGGNIVGCLPAKDIEVEPTPTTTCASSVQEMPAEFPGPYTSWVIYSFTQGIVESEGWPGSFIISYELLDESTVDEHVYEITLAEGTDLGTEETILEYEGTTTPEQGMYWNYNKSRLVPTLTHIISVSPEKPYVLYILPEYQANDVEPQSLQEIIAGLCPSEPTPASEPPPA